MSYCYAASSTYVEDLWLSKLDRNLSLTNQITIYVTSVV